MAPENFVRLGSERLFVRLGSERLSEIDLDGVCDDERGVRYFGKAVRQPNGLYMCLAQVGFRPLPRGGPDRGRRLRVSG